MGELLLVLAWPLLVPKDNPAKPTTGAHDLLLLARSASCTLLSRASLECEHDDNTVADMAAVITLGYMSDLKNALNANFEISRC
jgi:hypothetical protein